MREIDVVNEWLQIAYDDYDSALFLFQNKHPKPLEIICYHCQQSVEKSLKAYLCAKGIDVPKTHEVGLLCRRSGRQRCRSRAFPLALVKPVTPETDETDKHQTA